VLHLVHCQAVQLGSMLLGIRSNAQDRLVVGLCVDEVAAGRVVVGPPGAAAGAAGAHAAGTADGAGDGGGVAVCVTAGGCRERWGVGLEGPGEVLSDHLQALCRPPGDTRAGPTQECELVPVSATEYAATSVSHNVRNRQHRL